MAAMRSDGLTDGNFIQFVLRVDNNPTCDLAGKRQAMDVFDRLMEQYGDLAESILSALSVIGT